MPLCTLVFIYSYISLYHLCIISFMLFYHDLAIHVLSIFLSCMLLLIHIFIYVPIIHVHVLILMLCHLLLISIVLIIYAFLSCIPSMFHLIPLGISIIYSYHLHIPIMSSSIHLLSIFLSCSIYSFMYDNHMFTSYNFYIHMCLSFLYFRLSYLMTYLIISYHIL